MAVSGDGAELARLDIATVGESMVVLVPSHGESLESTAETALFPAGAESNVASYLSQLGHAVGWGSRVGNDPFGRRLLRSFSEIGIDVSQVVIDDYRPTGVYFKDPGGEPSVYYYRSGSAASALGVGDVAPLVARAARLHVTGITAALGKGAALTLFNIVREAKAAGKRISFDVNYRAPLWPTAEAAPVLAELGGLADTVFVGLDEAQHVWGIERADEIPAIFARSAEVVVKDGGEGATTFIGDDVFREPAPTVEVLEPVGAGDAFAAGYLSASIRGASPAERLRWGHLLAARVLIAPSDSVLLPPAGVLAAQAEVDPATWAALSFAGSEGSYAV